MMSQWACELTSATCGTLSERPYSNDLVMGESVAYRCYILLIPVQAAHVCVNRTLASTMALAGEQIACGNAQGISMLTTREGGDHHGWTYGHHVTATVWGQGWQCSPGTPYYRSGRILLVWRVLFVRAQYLTSMRMTERGMSRPTLFFVIGAVITLLFPLLIYSRLPWRCLCGGNRTPTEKRSLSASHACLGCWW